MHYVEKYFLQHSMTVSLRSRGDRIGPRDRNQRRRQICMVTFICCCCCRCCWCCCCVIYLIGYEIFSYHLMLLLNVEMLVVIKLICIAKSPLHIVMFVVNNNVRGLSIYRFGIFVFNTKLPHATAFCYFLFLFIPVFIPCRSIVENV